jgi:hypothetical protein
MKSEPTKNAETLNERQNIRAFTDETVRLMQAGKQDQTTIARVSIILYTTVGFRYLDIYYHKTNIFDVMRVRQCVKSSVIEKAIFVKVFNSCFST